MLAKEAKKAKELAPKLAKEAEEARKREELASMPEWRRKLVEKKMGLA